MWSHQGYASRLLVQRAASVPGAGVCVITLSRVTWDPAISGACILHGVATGSGPARDPGAGGSRETPEDQHTQGFDFGCPPGGLTFTRR
jgi:hypothetical protein